MKRLLLILFILLTIQLVNADPCTNLTETNCIDSYNQGYTTSESCNSMYYCYPTYEETTFKECKTVTRTDFTSCQYSFSTCYNNLAIDETQSRPCLCGEGTEFKLIDNCGNPTNWSGVCLKTNTCTQSTRTYLNQEITEYTNCEIAVPKNQIYCDVLAHEEKECYDNKLIIKEFTYTPNECNTECVLDKTRVVSITDCDYCANSICYYEDYTENSTSSSTSTTKKTSSTRSSTTNNNNNDEDEYETPTYDTTEKNILETTKESTKGVTNQFEPITQEIENKKEFPIEIVTISLLFTAVMLTGFIFLVKTN